MQAQVASSHNQRCQLQTKNKTPARGWQFSCASVQVALTLSGYITYVPTHIILLRY
jgi:hypothetical protein